jgi:hypothetical protein
MAASLEDATLPLLLILSGRDFVANEFDQVASAHPAWERLLYSATIERLAMADHTFSNAEWRNAVTGATIRWIDGLPVKAPGPH